MRWFLISLGFLILGWLVFAVSFSFPSQAQAETWSCTQYDETSEALKNKGINFRLLSWSVRVK